MPLALRTFLTILGVFVLLGFGLGIANLVLPELVSLSWDGRNVEGLDSIWVGLFASVVPGFVLGVVGAGVRSRISGRTPARKETE